MKQWFSYKECLDKGLKLKLQIARCNDIIFLIIKMFKSSIDLIIYTFEQIYYTFVQMNLFNNNNRLLTIITRVLRLILNVSVYQLYIDNLSKKNRFKRLRFDIGICLILVQNNLILGEGEREVVEIVEKGWDWFELGVGVGIGVSLLLLGILGYKKLRSRQIEVTDNILDEFPEVRIEEQNKIKEIKETGLQLVLRRREQMMKREEVELYKNDLLDSIRTEDVARQHLVEERLKQLIGDDNVMRLKSEIEQIITEEQLAELAEQEQLTELAGQEQGIALTEEEMGELREYGFTDENIREALNDLNTETNQDSTDQSFNLESDLEGRLVELRLNQLEIQESLRHARTLLEQARMGEIFLTDSKMGELKCFIQLFQDDLDGIQEEMNHIETELMSLERGSVESHIQSSDNLPDNLYNQDEADYFDNLPDNLYNQNESDYLLDVRREAESYMERGMIQDRETMERYLAVLRNRRMAGEVGIETYNPTDSAVAASDNHIYSYYNRGFEDNSSEYRTGYLRARYQEVIGEDEVLPSSSQTITETQPSDSQLEPPLDSSQQEYTAEVVGTEINEGNLLEQTIDMENQEQLDQMIEEIWDNSGGREMLRYSEEFLHKFDQQLGLDCISSDWFYFLLELLESMFFHCFYFFISGI